jgi:hypothetical protein
MFYPPFEFLQEKLLYIELPREIEPLFHVHMKKAHTFRYAQKNDTKGCDAPVSYQS